MRLALYSGLLLAVSCGPRSADAISLSGGDDPTTVANDSTSSGSDATMSGDVLRQRGLHPRQAVYQ